MFTKLETAITFCLWLFAFVVIGCESTTNPIEPKLGEEFQLGYGQTAIVRDDGLVVRFISVDEDSRCPVDVMCVWAGNAKVTIEVSRKNFALNTTLEPHEVTLSGYKIKLCAVNPYPKFHQSIQFWQYKVTLVAMRTAE